MASKNSYVFAVSVAGFSELRLQVREITLF